MYKITITTALSRAVQTSTYPVTKTRVLRYIPVLQHKNSKGMNPLPTGNRFEIPQCLEALKKLKWVGSPAILFRTIADLSVLFLGRDNVHLS